VSVRRDRVAPTQRNSAQRVRCERGVRCDPFAPAQAGAQLQLLPARTLGTGLRRGDGRSGSVARFLRRAERRLGLRSDARSGSITRFFPSSSALCA